jgi:hypothetical protein
MHRDGEQPIADIRTHWKVTNLSPAVSDEEAKQKYPDGWKAPKPYLRIVPQPK